MTTAELIREYRIQDGKVVGRPGTLYVPGGKNLPPAVVDELRRRKAEILAELATQEEERRAKEEAERRAREELRARILAGDVKLRAVYVDGDYPHWEVRPVEAGPVLVDLGAAREVGYSIWLRSDVAESLGEEWTVEDVKRLLTPEREAEERRKAEAEAARQEKFAEAARTGKPVELRRWMEPCDGSGEECSTDLVVELAMPDGRVERHRTHTH
ncbi:MAG: hypothetical protein QME79_12370 [Bacillota bacterium]|nr:hypothetical protein [Bacillota bacterium]